ncbi:MAG: JAB domain-containing protein [Gammaproteobacteria bacterium]|nr:JAB domain-containing protein [Gammaproteobacteria bacterium]
MAITDWPADERPREKLLLRGASALSDAELLAIFLRTGIKGMTAVDLARNLLEQHGSLRELLAADRSEFCGNLGLGPAKYALLQAVLEMGKRHLWETLTRSDTLASPADTKNYLTAQLRGQRNEVFACLFLDNKNRVIEYEELFFGTINGASVHPRQIIQRALSHNAASLILAHNHPSGVAEPSQADRQITQRIREALSLLDIQLLDHLVIGDGDIVSLAEMGWI